VGMEVHPTPGQAAFIRQAIESGRIHRPEDAVEQALSLWEERERRRAEILSAVDEAEASIAQGRGRLVTSEKQIDELVEGSSQRVLAPIILTFWQRPRTPILFLPKRAARMDEKNLKAGIPFLE
jgi:Arc/MetJ-type ribon-helix-helix transcriptional regulator